MDASSKPEFGHVLRAMSATYRQDVTAPMLQGYWMALSGMELDAFKRAVEVSMRECKFMPTPAEILEQSDESSALRAAQAWHAVTQVSHQGGAKLDDEIANHVIRLMGGWRHMTSTTSEQFHTWSRKEFLRLYEESLASETKALTAPTGSPVDVLADKVSERLGDGA